MAEEVEKPDESGRLDEGEQTETPLWLILSQIITAVLTFGGTFWLSLAGKGSAPFAIAGAAMLLLFRFGDLSSLSFEGFGTKGALSAARRETRKTTQVRKEAEQTITALRQIGQHLASMVMTVQASITGLYTSGKGARLTLEILMHDRGEILKELRAMGSSEQEIAEVMRSPDRATLMVLVASAQQAMRADYTALIHKEVTEVLRDMPTDMTALREIFAKYEITEKAERYLVEAERFNDSGEIDLKKLEPYY